MSKIHLKTTRYVEVSSAVHLLGIFFWNNQAQRINSQRHPAWKVESKVPVNKIGMPLVSVAFSS